MGQGSTDSMDIVKTLGSKTRLEALLLLFIYRKISLEELSTTLGKTKNTMIYHMRLLREQALVMELDEKRQHSIKPIKIYQLEDNFYEKLYIPFENISSLPEDQVLDQSKSIFHYNSILFETIREILARIENIYTKNQQKLRNVADIVQFHERNSIPRDLIPLSEKVYQEYKKGYQDLIDKTIEALTEEDAKTPNMERPYLAFNSVLPIKAIFEKMP